MNSQNRFFSSEKWQVVDNINKEHFACVCENGKEVTALQFLKAEKNTEAFIVVIKTIDNNCERLEKEIFKQKIKCPHERWGASCRLRGLTTSDLPKIFKILEELGDPLTPQFQEKIKAVLNGLGFAQSANQATFKTAARAPCKLAPLSNSAPDGYYIRRL